MPVYQYLEIDNYERQKIEELKQVTGINDISYLNPKNIETIIERTGSGQLNSTHIELLVKVLPEFTQQFIAVVQGAVNAQKNSIEGVADSLKPYLETLKLLIDKAHSDESIVKIAEIVLEISKLQVENNRTLERMQKENNKFWLALSSAVMASIVFTVAIGTRSKINIKLK